MTKHSVTTLGRVKNISWEISAGHPFDSGRQEFFYRLFPVTVCTGCPNKFRRHVNAPIVRTGCPTKCRRHVNATIVRTGYPNARRRYFNATRAYGAPTIYRRVRGRGTDRDAACGDVIMNDDQAKKIKTDDSGASLIFFIYD